MQTKYKAYTKEKLSCYTGKIQNLDPEADVKT